MTPVMTASCIHPKYPDGVDSGTLLKPGIRPLRAATLVAEAAQWRGKPGKRRVLDPALPAHHN